MKSESIIVLSQSLTLSSILLYVEEASSSSNSSYHTYIIMQYSSTALEPIISIQFILCSPLIIITSLSCLQLSLITVFVRNHHSREPLHSLHTPFLTSSATHPFAPRSTNRLHHSTSIPLPCRRKTFIASLTAIFTAPPPSQPL